MVVVEKKMLIKKKWVTYSWGTDAYLYSIE